MGLHNVTCLGIGHYSEEFLEGLYNQVPNDIWLTHDTPALGDLLPPSQESIHAGGQSLAEAIQRIKPRYVFCGPYL